jgi:hypothetical protein
MDKAMITKEECTDLMHEVMPCVIPADSGPSDEYTLRMGAQAALMLLWRQAQAAPDLLEALVRFVRLCPSAEGLGGHAPMGAFTISADYARAAIAKATGDE